MVLNNGTVYLVLNLINRVAFHDYAHGIAYDIAYVKAVMVGIIVYYPFN